jgi:hypothetical protein
VQLRQVVASHATKTPKISMGCTQPRRARRALLPLPWAHRATFLRAPRLRSLLAFGALLIEWRLPNGRTGPAKRGPYRKGHDRQSKEEWLMNTDDLRIEPTLGEPASQHPPARVKIALKRLAAKIGLGHVTPHVMRHTAARMMQGGSSNP